MLGGGHGWLQGQYGLMVDNLLSARLVLANGTAVSVSDTENADLFWALRGAGHNFGIVTSFEYKIYDHTPENENWAIETFVFTRDKLEAVFEEANKQLEERPIELTQMSLFMRVPDVEADNVSGNSYFFLLIEETDKSNSPSSSSSSSFKAPPYPQSTPSPSSLWLQRRTLKPSLISPASHLTSVSQMTARRANTVQPTSASP